MIGEDDSGQHGMESKYKLNPDVSESSPTNEHGHQFKPIQIEDSEEDVDSSWHVLETVSIYQPG